MKDSVRLCNQPECSREARAKGDECRKCYKLLWQREKRAQEKFERSHASFDQSTSAVDRVSYIEWLLEQ